MGDKSAEGLVESKALKAIGFEVFRELHRLGDAFFHLALDGALVTTHRFPFLAVFELASFDIEKNLDFPRPERIAGHGAAQEFLH